jgi:hypothetical protein
VIPSGQSASFSSRAAIMRAWCFTRRFHSKAMRRLRGAAISLSSEVSPGWRGDEARWSTNLSSTSTATATAVRAPSSLRG